MTGDPYLDDLLSEVGGWLEDGSVTHPTRVIPVGESLDAQQWVLPAEQVLAFVRGARAVALTDCACRSHYDRCTNPTDVCLLLDDSAERHVASGDARYLSVDEAAQVLRRAEEHGLVHLAVYDPGDVVSAICNCCACCCHYLQFLLRYGRRDLTARADYSAQTDTEACTGCGECVERCAFGARVLDGATLCCDAEACYGCGLCVAACPAGAIRMVKR